MQAQGDLYLSKTKPAAKTAGDGTFVLSMLAFDRQSYRQVQPWRLLWAGVQAKEFWSCCHDKLVPGVGLGVTAEKLRQIASTGRHCGPEIIADVVNLTLKR